MMTSIANLFPKVLLRFFHLETFLGNLLAILGDLRVQMSDLEKEIRKRNKIAKNNFKDRTITQTGTNFNQFPCNSNNKLQKPA